MSNVEMAQSVAKIKNPIILGIIAVLVIATISAIFYVSNRDTMVVLFSDLTEKEIQDISKLANENQISYQITEDGHTIKVPEDSVYLLRMKIVSGSTVFSQTVGFELFDEVEFGMTDFMQKINYQRALQGEIARTIMSLDEVKRARIHLVIPEKKLFDNNDSHSEAAVYLQLKSHQQLGKAQLAGIQKLVAAAVPGLSVVDVSVVNQNGTMLTTAARTDLEKTLSSTTDTVRQLEQHLALKANKILERAYGKGNALVIVDVELNLEKVNIHTEKILGASQGNEGIARKKVSKKYQGKGNKSKTDSEVTEVVYLNGKSSEVVHREAGSIKRLSVAVLLPLQKFIVDPEKIRKLISMAVGLDEARGDQISVQEVHIAGGNIETVALKPMEVTPDSLYINGNSFVRIDEEESPLVEKPFMGVNKSVTGLVATEPLNTLSDSSHWILNTFNRYWLSADEDSQFTFMLLLGLSILLSFVLLYLMARVVFSNRLRKQERNDLLAEMRKIINEDRPNKIA